MRENELIIYVTQLVFQLAIIILASWLSRTVCNKIKIPNVIGYIVMGIIIGPFLMGSVAFTQWFPHGMFPLAEGPISVSPHLYAFSSIAAIILLFLSGLETDVVLFVRYALVGSCVGIGGALASFTVGFVSSVLLTHMSLIHPLHLFIGTIFMATSVGITTSILSANHKINSPEGVTILSAAVFDDVLGIVTLAIVVGISDTLTSLDKNTDGLWLQILLTAVKAISIWLGSTFIGVMFSRKLGRGLKSIFNDSINITLIALGLALLVGGVFKILGLSMVIGAYTVGLSLSNTDLSYDIQEKMAPITTLFTPIFFIVTGMLINLTEILNWSTVFMGVVLLIGSLLAKYIGAVLPALGLGFNMLGASRIGVGMGPRGEVALIIAGIGISTGILSNAMFGAVLIMVVGTSLITPLLLEKLLVLNKSGTKKEIQEDSIKTEFNFKNSTLTRLILADFIQLLEEERFFINKIIRNKKEIYHIRKDNIFLTLTHVDTTLVFLSDQESISFVKTALFEATTNISESAQVIKNSLVPHNVISEETTSHDTVKLSSYIKPGLVNLHLQANNKKDIILELSDLLDQEGVLKDKKKFVQEVMAREHTFSTGLQEGIAIPHAKSIFLEHTAVAIGIKQEGCDFDSLDGKPSTIFILMASRNDANHLSILTKISTLLNQAEFRQKLLACTRKIDVVKLLTTS